MEKFIREEFGKVEDLRCPAAKMKTHKLVDILIVIMCGVICGLQKLEEIETYAKERFQFLHDAFGVETVPSDSTMSRILNIIRPQEIGNAVISIMKRYASELGDIVAVDGKAIRATAQKDKPNSALQILTAYCVESGVVLGQAAIPENQKTNEIPVFQALLNDLNLAGKIVTADAMHCQKETCKKVLDRKGNYLFGLKGNQGSLFEEVKLFFEDPINRPDIQTYTAPLEKNGGRIESRVIAVCYSPTWLSMIKEWAGLASVIAVTRKITDKYKTTVETEYYISSLSVAPQILLETIRKHWGVESMHWLLDVVFDEDATCFMNENANQSLNILRKLALMIHRDYIKGLNKKTKPTTKVNMLQCLLRSEMIVTLLSQSMK